MTRVTAAMLTKTKRGVFATPSRRCLHAGPIPAPRHGREFGEVCLCRRSDRDSAADQGSRGVIIRTGRVITGRSGQRIFTSRAKSMPSMTPRAGGANNLLVVASKAAQRTDHK